MPRPEDIAVLKEIANLGALHSLVEVSTSQLAQILGSSQQTASRRVLELEQSGYLRREIGVRRQLMRLTEEGVNVLAREYAAYQALFEKKSKLRIHGRVASGLGEGRYYLGRAGYLNQFRDKLGFTPYAGTLNLEIEGPETNKLRLLKTSPAIRIDGFEAENRTFGAVDAWRARLGALDVAVILPQRTHHVRTLEVVAAQYLRDELMLQDGDGLDVEVQLA